MIDHRSYTIYPKQDVYVTAVFAANKSGERFDVN